MGYVYVWGIMIFFYVNFSRWRYRVGLFTANVIWRYLPLSNQPWQSFGFSSACFIWHCFFSLHKDKLQILKLRKIPLETLGKTKEGLFVSAPSFQASRFPDPTSPKHLSFSSAFFMPPFSYNLFLSGLIRPHFPLFSHTTLLTVNPQCWLRDEKMLGCLNHILRQVQGEIPTDEFWNISIELTKGHIL